MRETYFEVLKYGDGEAIEADCWNRVRISVPTLIHPFRADGLTLGFNLAGTIGTLQFLMISFSPVNPIRPDPHIEGLVGQTSFTGLRSIQSARGVCYLSAPGEWWVRCQVGGVGSEAFFGRKIPFQFIPEPDDTLVDQLVFGRGSSAKPPLGRNVVIAGGGIGNGQVISVQDQLDGVVAFEVATPATANQDLRFRWRTSTSPYIKLPVGAITRFEGPTLPLADAWIQNNAIGNETVGLTSYR